MSGRGDLRGISGGAHPLESIFKKINKKTYVILSLDQNIWI